MKTVERIQREVERLGYIAKETCAKGFWDLTATNRGDGHSILVTATRRAEAWDIVFATAKKHIGGFRDPMCVTLSSK